MAPSAPAGEDAGRPGRDAGVPSVDEDAGPRETPDAGPLPAAVDCDAIAARFALCQATAETCEAVYEAGEGCAAVCAAAGLVCTGAFENVEGMCAADEARPALGCDSGHQSDYCVCARGACTPSCDGRACGDDGCGGRCGECGDGLTCVAGRCEAGAVDCSTYPFDPAALLAEREGFGRRATGGDPSRVYTVTHTGASGAGSLRAGLESSEPYWIVFDVGVTSEAVIDLGSAPVRVRSNKTLDGRGRQILIDGAIELRDGVRDVILTDVRLTNSHGARCTQESDVILVRGDGADTPEGFENRDLWFHHLELFEGGDGLIDIRGGSRITISWCHMHDHSKGMLLSNGRADELEGREMEVTYHHNFFDRLSKRAPRQNRGRVHYFNNYNFEWWEYAVAVVERGELRSEANVYQARPGRTCGSIFRGCLDPAPCGDRDYEVSKLAVSTDWASDVRGYVASDGDLLLEDAVVEVNEPGRVFTPGYAYRAEPATTALASRVRDGSGPRTGYCR